MTDIQMTAYCVECFTASDTKYPMAWATIHERNTGHERGNVMVKMEAAHEHVSSN